MNDQTPLTPREVLSIAAALHGSVTGSLEALASKLDIDLDTLQAYCDGSRPIPPEFKKALYTIIGSTTPHDTAWRRDQWALAYGVPDMLDRRRTYLFHLWPPRFRARLVQIDSDTGDPVLAEEPADITSGIVYAAGDDYVLAEIEWSDQSPTGQALVDLFEAAADGLDALTHSDEDC